MHLLPKRDKGATVYRRILWILMALLLLTAACGESGDDSPPPEATSSASADAGEPASTEPGAETTPTPTTQAEEPAEESGGGEVVGSATLTIGDETWTFDQVAFCANPPVEPKDESFVLIAKQGDLQLIVRINDDTGAQRLEGEGVYDTIDFTNIADPTLGVWLASSQADGEQFLVVEGLTVTASANFDDLRTTEFDNVPGTLAAPCP